MATRKSKSALTDAHIDAVIRRNLRRFAKPGVVSVRPGILISKGVITKRPAIVASVRRKLRDLPDTERLPDSVQGIPVDVRPLSPTEALRATDPEGFAQELVHVPRGNVPIELQTPNFAHERNLRGQLIGAKVDKAVSRVRPRRPGETHGAAKAPPKRRPKGGAAGGGKYQKLPPATFAAVTDQFTVTCFASPDDGWPTLQRFLQTVNERLTVGMYEFTAPYIVDAVSTSLKNKTLSLVLDDPGYDTTHRDQTCDVTYDQLKKALGNGLDFAWAAEGADKHNSIHLFPAAYHIKVAVADGASFFLSSGNFNRTNQPPIDPLNHPLPDDAHTASLSDRDWHVIIVNKQISNVFEKLILRDLQQALPGQQNAPAPTLRGNGNTAGRQFKKFFPAKQFTGQMTIQPVLTPDNYVDVILPLIQSAKTRFWMQTQYIKPSSKFVQDVDLPLAQRSILERLIDAVRVLTKKGVDVRIIVDSRVTSSMIEQLQKTGGLNGKKILRQAHVHNKGMIIDDHTVVIGSQNWSTEGVDTNRDASVVINFPEMVDYWATLFQSDWDTMTMSQEDPAS
jgi:hypothetical protein